jgi:hypothetical protein
MSNGANRDVNKGESNKILAPITMHANFILPDWRESTHPRFTKTIAKGHPSQLFHKHIAVLSNMKVMTVFGIVAPLLGFLFPDVVTSLSAVAPRIGNKVLVLVEPSPLTYGGCDIQISVDNVFLYTFSHYVLFFFSQWICQSLPSALSTFTFQS